LSKQVAEIDPAKACLVVFTVDRERPVGKDGRAELNRSLQEICDALKAHGVNAVPMVVSCGTVEVLPLPNRLEVS
jgi:hypothetical protein